MAQGTVETVVTPDPAKPEETTSGPEPTHVPDYVPVSEPEPADPFEPLALLMQHLRSSPFGNA